MALLIDQYYLIRATSEFLELVQRSGVDIEGFEDDFVGPALWANAEPDATATDAHIHAMKLLFIAHIKSVAKETGILSELLSALPTDHLGFEKYWTVEPVGFPERRARDVLQDLRENGGLGALSAENASFLAKVFY